MTLRNPETVEKQRKIRTLSDADLGGGWWIRTTEGIASRFTVCPLWPLGKSPIFGFGACFWLELVDGLEPPTC